MATGDRTLFSFPCSAVCSDVTRRPITGVVDKSKVKSRVLPGRSFLIIIASADQELSYAVQTELAGRGGGVSRWEEWDTAIFSISSDSFHRLPYKGNKPRAIVITTDKEEIMWNIHKIWNNNNLLKKLCCTSKMSDRYLKKSAKTSSKILNTFINTNETTLNRAKECFKNTK